MSMIDLNSSIEEAEKRLASHQTTRRKRSDIGVFRIRAGGLLRRVLAGDEYPGIQAILAELGDVCRRRGLHCPSRATVYQFMAREPGRPFDAALLPVAVRAALYNLSLDSTPVGQSRLVPGAQLAFYCFNYGELAAVHFAAGMPWLPLHQARRMRGWRPKSQGLLDAVLLARGIPHG